MVELLHRVPYDLLMAMSEERNDIRKISRQIDCTYPHLTKVCNKFIKMKLAKRVYLNRRDPRAIVLTNKGLKLKETFKNIKQLTKT
jgi:predicted transcriptional regulator